MCMYVCIPTLRRINSEEPHQMLSLVEVALIQLQMAFPDLACFVHKAAQP